MDHVLTEHDKVTSAHMLEEIVARLQQNFESSSTVMVFKNLKKVTS